MPRTPAESFRIRPASVADAPAILAIYNEAVRNTVATFDTEARSLPDQVSRLEEHGPSHLVVVAEQAGSVIGWASLSPWSDRKAYAGTAEVSFYVAENLRGKGVGRQLLEQLVRRGRSVGLHTLLARIADGSVVSLHLHESLGFTRAGIMREVGWKFDRWVDVHLLQYVYRDP